MTETSGTGRDSAHRPDQGSRTGAAAGDARSFTATGECPALSSVQRNAAGRAASEDRYEEKCEDPSEGASAGRGGVAGSGLEGVAWHVDSADLGAAVACVLVDAARTGSMMPPALAEAMSEPMAVLAALHHDGAVRAELAAAANRSIAAARPFEAIWPEPLRTSLGFLELLVQAQPGGGEAP